MVQQFVDKAIEKGYFASVSLLYAKKDIVIYKYFNYDSHKIPEWRECANKPPIYDLASLTKPLITAPLIVKLIEEGALSLNTKVKDIFPLFHKDITLLHLLTHTSGIQAWSPLYLNCAKDDILNYIVSLPLKAKPGRKVIYSCLGYIVLKEVIEKVTKRKFFDVADEYIIKKLSLENTFINVPLNIKKHLIPSEKGNQYEIELSKKYKYNEPFYTNYQWRDYILQGETNDCNSWYGGGSLGNAGLFSSVDDIHKLALQFLPDTTLFKDRSLNLFYNNFTPFKGSHRSVGFKLNSSLITSGGKALNKEAIGHNGFTGTSLWIDNKSEEIYIILSNRLYPEFKPYNMNRFRRKAHRLLKKINEKISN